MRFLRKSLTVVRDVAIIACAVTLAIAFRPMSE